MKKVLSVYLKPYYGRMLFGFVIKFIGTIMDLCLPWILAYMIDTVIPQGQRDRIYLWGLAMLVCSVLALTFNIIANRMASKVARDTTETLRHDLFEKIMWLSNAKTDAFTKPSLISRLTTDTYNVHQMLGRVQRLGVRAPILVIGGILVTLTLDPVLTLVLVSVMPVTAFVTYYFSQKSIPMYHALQRAVDKFVRLLREDIAGIRVIKVLSKTDYETKRYDALKEGRCHDGSRQSGDKPFSESWACVCRDCRCIQSEYGKLRGGKNPCISHLFYHYIKCDDQYIKDVRDCLQGSCLGKPHCRGHRGARGVEACALRAAAGG